MPKIMSFGDSNPELPNDSDWAIYDPLQSLNYQGLFAKRGDVEIRIAEMPGLKNCHAQVIYGAVQMTRISFECGFGDQILKFDVDTTKTTYKLSSDEVSIRLTNARIQVGFGNLGTGTFRDSWRDSDVSKGICGFTRVETPHEELIRPIVWASTFLALRVRHDPYY